MTGATVSAYDVLDRSTSVTDGGTGKVAAVYSGKDVTVTLSPAPTGENQKVKNFEYDGLGRLKSVCEVTSASGSAACGQAVAKNGFLTSYGYDALGHLINVTQGSQTRTRSYDGLGRVTLAFNPESGTTQYVYDFNPANHADDSEGDLVQVIDNAGVTTNFVYDGLHRLNDVGLQPWGFYSGTANPVCRRFRYDTVSTPDPGVTVANTLGRMEFAGTDDCGKAGNGQWNPITRYWFSYDNDGRVTDTYEQTPHSGGFYHSSATYAANGAVTSLSPGIGGGQVTLPWQYGLDGEGRPYSVGNPVGGIATLVASTIYNVDGSLGTLTMANGDTDAYQYDPNTGRMTQFKFTVGATPKTLTGTLTWSANGTLDQLVIADQFNAANSQTCAYGYDDLARLISANCGTPWSQTFTYDRFGNVFKSGNGPFQPTYDTTTNRMTAIVGEGAPSYDANGKLLNTEGHAYVWDVNWNVPSSVDGKTLIYDAFGQMVEVQNGATYTEFMYGPTGKVAKMNGATEIESWEPIPSGVVVHAPIVNFIRHNDWLGSSRFASTYPGRTKYFDVAYAPFGEQYAASGTTDLSFTGQTQDVTATNGGLYDFPARKYSPVQGRFISPDLGNEPSLANPQSWNLYAYVFNNPLALTDSFGNSPTGNQQQMMVPLLEVPTNASQQWIPYQMPVIEATLTWNAPTSANWTPRNDARSSSLAALFNVLMTPTNFMNTITGKNFLDRFMSAVNKANPLGAWAMGFGFGAVLAVPDYVVPYNFYNVVGTRGTFIEAVPPVRAPDLVSPPGLNRAGEPIVSMYWDAPESGGMFRQSNHWGVMGTSNWSLKGPSGFVATPNEFKMFPNTSDMPTGFIKYSDLQPMPPK